MSLKRTVRHSIDFAANAVGVLSRCRSRACRGGVALMYHRVLPDAIADRYPLDGLVVPSSLFEQQVAWLASNADVVTLAELDARRQDGTKTDRPTVAITFDDGFADNAEIAAPALNKHRVPGVFFVSTGFVETGELLWFDQAALRWGQSDQEARQAALGGGSAPTLGAWMALLKRLTPTRRNEVLASLDESCGPLKYDRDYYRAMTPQQTAELHASGHEIGAHTVSHPIMPGLTDDELQHEVVRSRDAITSWVGEVPTSFCYPNGDADDRVVEAVRRAGFARATVTVPGVNGPSVDAFRLRRMYVQPTRVTSPSGRHSNLAFASEVWGLHSRLRDRHSWQGVD